MCKGGPPTHSGWQLHCLFTVYVFLYVYVQVTFLCSLNSAIFSTFVVKVDNHQTLGTASEPIIKIKIYLHIYSQI